MEPKFTHDDIRRHLAELGYSNIPDERLKVFAKDLRRLMKYEERKRLLEADLEDMENRRPGQKIRLRLRDHLFVLYFLVMWD
jgi:hypothetical protein